MGIHIYHDGYYIVDDDHDEVFVHRMDHPSAVPMAEYDSATEVTADTATVVDVGEYGIGSEEITFELKACD
ncbi:MAG: hypothetical protein V5A21_05300 [Halapricum sp.]